MRFHRVAVWQKRELRRGQAHDAGRQHLGQGDGRVIPAVQVECYTLHVQLSLMRTGRLIKGGFIKPGNK